MVLQGEQRAQNEKAMLRTEQSRRGEKTRRLVNVISPGSPESALPLYRAVVLGHFEIAQELLNHGADPEFEGCLVRRCLDEAAYCFRLREQSEAALQFIEAHVSAGVKVEDSTWVICWYDHGGVETYYRVASIAASWPCLVSKWPERRPHFNRHSRCSSERIKRR